jgi:hypothetical protein
MRRDIQLSHEDVLRLMQSTEDNPALHEKMGILVASLQEGTRFYIETVEPSFMSRQERLNDLRFLIDRIKENTVASHRYRKHHQQAIGSSVGIALTLLWKEGTVS